MTSRRALLWYGLTGGALLAGAGLWYRSGAPIIPAPGVNGFLQSDDSLILVALIPVLLDGALSDEPEHQQQQIDTVLERLEASIRLLLPRTRDELRTLFDGLQSAAGRLALIGTLQAVPELDFARRNALLNDWRESFLTLLNNAYAGLQALVVAAFYGDERNWALLDYRGPPSVRSYPDSPERPETSA